ncbi:hypothetical protein ASE63_15650 [Bosea sp. Root381]|uniref:hypothetical protein n=1 Tax=Bosea sp. Root381 TaxID=1736524 RepID=UPI0007147ECA|nr:hypothetical protein [Bosea sp. Root381]KRE15688.1 hypothetical protein ASE63_15650 [Bosea sp. Root381]
MPSPTAPAAAPGLPATDFAASIFPRAKLETMSMRDLYNIFQLIGSLQGAVTQSLFISGHGGQTAAGEMLEELSGVLVCAMSDVSEMVQAREPIDAAEANWRGWLLLSNAAFFSEDLTEIALTAANAASVAHKLRSHQ